MPPDGDHTPPDLGRLTYQQSAGLINAAIERSSENRRALVEAEIQVLNERITAVEQTGIAHRQGFYDVLTQRLNDIDRANVILSENLTRVPTQLQLAVATLKELEDVKFQAVRDAAKAEATGINDRFALLDKQTVREKAAADLALAAAFDAQKEASAAQNFANSESIRKSEATTAEVIKKNEQTQQQGQQSLSDKIDDMKDRMNRLETLITTIQTERSTMRDTKTDSRAGQNLGWQALGGFIALIVLALAVYGAFKGNSI